jgi:DNA-binding MarR family transcriptional regulator
MDHRPRVSYDGAVGASKEDLASEVWRPLARFFFDTARHRQRVLSEAGLTPNDIRALMALDPERGRTMRALAEEWLCDASNATFIVDRLEERGLAERRSVPSDRRVKMVVLTTRGNLMRGRVLERFFEPPPELLELSRTDLEAIRDAVRRLPITHGWVESVEVAAAP